jgi:hypothetical protein
MNNIGREHTSDLETAIFKAKQLYKETGKDIGIFCIIPYGEDPNLDSNQFYVEVRDPYIESYPDEFVLLVDKEYL